MSAHANLGKRTHGGEPSQGLGVGNFDKRRSKNAYLMSTLDLPVAKSLFMLDIRLDAKTENFHLLIRMVGEEKKAARSWIPAERLDEVDDDGQNQLNKLLKTFLNTCSYLSTKFPELKPYWLAKRLLATRLLEEQAFSKFVAEQEVTKKAPVEVAQTASNDFLERYGGQVKELVRMEESKSMRFKRFVDVFCTEKIQKLEESVTASSYKSFDFCQILYLTRQSIVDQYLADVCLQ